MWNANRYLHRTALLVDNPNKLTQYSFYCSIFCVNCFYFIFLLVFLSISLLLLTFSNCCFIAVFSILCLCSRWRSFIQCNFHFFALFSFIVFSCQSVFCKMLSCVLFSMKNVFSLLGLPCFNVFCAVWLQLPNG